jgi:hypothetical protein
MQWSPAFSAISYRRPSKVFEDLVAQGGIGLRSSALRGASPLEGGIPINVDGKQDCRGDPRLSRDVSSGWPSSKGRRRRSEVNPPPARTDRGRLVVLRRCRREWP